MISMRALLTDGVRGCQVKALHRELVITCPCMSLIEIHDSETHWITTLDTANEIHSLLDQGCNPQSVREMLRAGLKFSLPATSELLASCSSPFTHH